VSHHDIAGDSTRPLQRAIERGQLLHAELAARELGWLNLADALALAALNANDDPALRACPSSADTDGSRS
jgi:hypothetical protein